MLDLNNLFASPKLPTLPTVAVRLLELSKNANTSVQQAVDVFKLDPMISAKLLRATNSAYFGFKSKVTSIEHAVSLLGIKPSMTLALSFSVCRQAVLPGKLSEHYRAYWLQSIVQATSAEMLCSHCRGSVDCEFFSVGLLSDIGRLAFLKVVGNDYVPVIEEAARSGRELHDVEAEELGIDHIRVAEKMLTDWQLPEVLVSAVCQHHASGAELTRRQNEPTFSLLKSAAVAAVVGDYYCRPDKHRSLERLRKLTGEFFNFSEDKLTAFLAQVASRLEKSSELFNIDPEKLPKPDDLIAEAGRQILERALPAQAESTAATTRQKAAEQQKQSMEAHVQQLKENLMYDPLTGLCRRNVLDATLEKETVRASRLESPLGMIFIDVDHFKILNDRYGHQCGDHVLQQVARLIDESVRPSDLSVRYGGEEFIVLVTEPTEKLLDRLCEAIRSRVAESHIEFDKQAIAVTVSVGATMAVPPRASDNNFAPMLIAAADDAMYEAKRLGRNTVCVRSMLSDGERQIEEAVVKRRFSRWIVEQGILSVSQVAKTLAQCRMPERNLGDLASQEGHLTAADVGRIHEQTEKTHEHFGNAALRLALLSEEQLACVLALQREDPTTVCKSLVRQHLVTLKQAVEIVDQYAVWLASGAGATAELPSTRWCIC